MPKSSRSAIAVIVAAVLISFLILSFAFNRVPAPPNFEENGILGRPLRVGIVTWPGYAGGIVANNGFKPNKQCIYWEKYNLQVEFVLLEDVDIRAKSFARGGAGDVDVVWTTVDFWANELPGFIDGGVPAKAIMQVSWSTGGDAIVVDSSISSVEDLKDRKIALALLTPSHWFLENVLQNSSLSEPDIIKIMDSVIGKDSSPDARIDFVANKVDAAVVWEPDVTEAIEKRENAKILVSTETINRLLADFMVARQDFIEKHPEVIDAFIRGWLDGTVVANKDHDLVVKLLMEHEPLYGELGKEKTKAGLSAVKWADLDDNIEMFGLEGNEPLFDKLFTTASSLWLKRRLIKRAIAPEKAADTTFLKQIQADRSKGK